MGRVARTLPLIALMPLLSALALRAAGIPFAAPGFPFHFSGSDAVLIGELYLVLLGAAAVAALLFRCPGAVLGRLLVALGLSCLAVASLSGHAALGWPFAAGDGLALQLQWLGGSWGQMLLHFGPGYLLGFLLFRPAARSAAASSGTAAA